MAGAAPPPAPGDPSMASTRAAIGILGMLLIVAAGTGFAAPEGSGLPLPRFVSLRADEVNLRAGPGVQYPVEWVYNRRHLPVEVIAEYRTWRKIRDWQGTQGWVHQSMLSGNRTFIVTGKLRTLRRRADARGDAVARAEAGVIGRLLECPDASTWCRVDVDGFEGWFRRVEFWGVHRGEVVK